MYEIYTDWVESHIVQNIYLGKNGKMLSSLYDGGVMYWGECDWDVCECVQIKVSLHVSK